MSISRKHKTRRGVYLTPQNVSTLNRNIRFLGTMKKLSPKEKKVFGKIKRKIKNPDYLELVDFGRGRAFRSSKNVWLTPSQAKYLLAWKEAALEGKILNIGIKGIRYGTIPNKLIVEKWKDLFGENVSKKSLERFANELRLEKNINLYQANVSILKTGEQKGLKEKDAQKYLTYLTEKKRK
jgi:hypothetical protein